MATSSPFTVEQLLIIERLKTKILRQIIHQKLDINIDDTIDDLIREVGENIKVNFKESSKEKVNNEFKPSVDSPIKRESVKKVIDTKRFKQLPKSSDEIDAVITDSMGDDLKKMITVNFGVFNYAAIKNEIDKAFQELSTSRSYTNIIASIKNNRMFHLAVMNLKEYTAQLSVDIARIRSIFTEKEFECKKINGIISKMLTPLDYRLVFYEGFEKLHIELDQIDKLRTTLQNCVNYPTVITCFDDTHFINYFLSYNSIFFDLKFMIEIYIDNPYKFKNIIYIDSPSEDELGFSYYLLNKIDGSTKYWTLDRRLEALTRDLSQNLKQYLVHMFKKIYKSCYGHNKLVDTFKTKYPVLEIDSVLLLNNLFLVFDELRLNKMLREILKTKSLHLATTNDKFDKITDDKGQYADFKEMKVQGCDKINLVLSLFDDMDEKTALAFYTEHS